MGKTIVMAKVYQIASTDAHSILKSTGRVIYSTWKIIVKRHQVDLSNEIFQICFFLSSDSFMFVMAFVTS